MRDADQFRNCNRFAITTYLTPDAIQRADEPQQYRTDPGEVVRYPSARASVANVLRARTAMNARLDSRVT